MATCPNGHQSMAADWCPVCGLRMPAPGGAVPPPPGPPAGGYQTRGGGEATMAAELCPQCRTPREGMAPFCEECRYNFLTNSPTTYLPPTPQHGPPPGRPYGQTGPQGYPGQPDGTDHPGRTGHGEPPGRHEQHGQHGQHGAHGQQLGGGYPGGGQQAPPRPRPGQSEASGDWLLPPPTPPAGPPPAAPAHGSTGSGYGYPPGPGAGPSTGPLPAAGPGHGPAAPGPRRGGWAVSVGPDRDYFTAMMRRSGPEAAQLVLPAYAPEQQIPLTGPQVTIGRRRHSTGEIPDIDLSRAPEDPGVSHQHAILVEQPDGSWAVVDQDSTNGTTVNHAEEPIQPFIPVQLHEGDRVHVGAWTTLTLYRA
ncbi:FHA domain-containing protein [Streptomyces aidingensis]|uniref:FHA domain-containing protein n=1 Tax=Streptomyces aidingensis TaxID=910347 RepID=A0A1I1FAH3_9ACTN|nr:FHA domain-containing protein [Streptomyces aidingensis]SFB96377.1 FHA domain-containing protein [Streptomyces aidingensis]